MVRKMDPKSIQKGKVKTSKNNNHQEGQTLKKDSSLTVSGTRGPGPRGGGRGRGSPSPKGRWDIGVLYAKPPQPRGWWDF